MKEGTLEDQINSIISFYYDTAACSFWNRLNTSLTEHILLHLRTHPVLVVCHEILSSGPSKALPFAVKIIAAF